LSFIPTENPEGPLLKGEIASCRVMAVTEPAPQNVSSRKKLLALFYRYKLNFLYTTKSEDRQFNSEVQHLGQQAGACYPKWLWKKENIYTYHYLRETQ
jgi:hypothetical protein